MFLFNYVSQVRALHQVFLQIFQEKNLITFGILTMITESQEPATRILLSNFTQRTPPFRRSVVKLDKNKYRKMKKNHLT